MYVVDSNLYIEALRDPVFGKHLADWEARVAPKLWLSSIVAFEILLGARDERHAQGYERRLLNPFRQRTRILPIDTDMWREAAKALRVLSQRPGLRQRIEQRRFLCDVLVAASCRRVGATLLTANPRDFALIHEVLAFRYVTRFP